VAVGAALAITGCVLGSGLKALLQVPISTVGGPLGPIRGYRHL
jgi:hypothetical protein